MLSYCVPPQTSPRLFLYIFISISHSNNCNDHHLLADGLHIHLFSRLVFLDFKPRSPTSDSVSPSSLPYCLFLASREELTSTDSKKHTLRSSSSVYNLCQIYSCHRIKECGHSFPLSLPCLGHIMQLNSFPLL